MKFLVFLSLLLILSSCRKTEEEACTMVFIQHNIRVIDSNGTALILDTFYTQNNSTKEYIHIDKKSTDSSHHYPLINDHQINQLSNANNTAFTFSAIKGNDTVKAEYLFKNKNCHPFLVNGNSTLIFKP